MWPQTVKFALPGSSPMPSYARHLDWPGSFLVKRAGIFQNIPLDCNTPASVLLEVKRPFRGASRSPFSTILAAKVPRRRGNHNVILQFSASNFARNLFDDTFGCGVSARLLPDRGPSPRAKLPMTPCASNMARPIRSCNGVSGILFTFLSGPIQTVGSASCPSQV